MSSENSEKNDSNQFDYRNDKSLTRISDDQFKHSHYVEVLTDILEKCETPINVGLYGKWGVGKTSIVHMLKEKIDDKLSNKFKYFEVNAWGLSRESLQQGILEEINSQLGKKAIPQQEIEDDLYNIKEVDSVSYKKTIKNFSIILGILAPIAGIIAYTISPENIFEIISTIGISSIIATLIPITKLFLGSSKRIIPKTVSTLQFNKLYQRLIDTQKNKKSVVVIDNLDRCDDKVAVDLLGIIQTFMVKKNCINILACDDEAIIKHLRNVRGKDYTDRDGNEFLSKFFQITIRIPPFIGENLEQYADNLMKSRSVTFSSFVRPILISGAIENPRKINQFLNNAVALFRLAALKENSEKLPKGVITENTEFLVKMIVIRHEWPYFFKALEKNPNLINEPTDLKNWYELQEKNNNSNQIDGLEKFLNKTTFAHADDVIPFLRLNQESYAAESGIDEFSEAVISNDIPTVIELFGKLEIDKENQYFKKLEELTNKYADKMDIPSLLICTYSIIAILEKLQDESLKKLTVALLGRYLSTLLLSELDKYDFSKQNLFPYFEEMGSHYSIPIYNKILNSIIDNSQINKKLINQFFDNGEIISKETMDKLDEIVSGFVDTDENVVLDYTVELCTNYDWPKINISKPSYLLIHIIDNLKFDSSEIDNKRISTYVSIHKRISEKEQLRFVNHLQLKIQEYAAASQTIPHPLLDLINSTSILESKTLIDSLKTLYNTLLNSISRNPDNEQKKLILQFLIKFESHLNTISESDEYGIKLNETLSAFLESGDQNILLWFNTLIKNSETNYLNSDQVLQGYLKNMENTALGNADVLKFILANVPSAKYDALIAKIVEIINTGEPSKYQTILNILVENPSVFVDDLISTVITSCKSLSSKMEYPQFLALDEIIVKLHKSLYPHQVESISQRAIELILNDDPSMQDNGLNLLSIINERTGSVTDLVGINESISMAEKFINENNELARKYMNFILKYSARLRWRETDQILDLIKLSLSEGKPVHIHNMGLDYVSQNTDLLKKDLEYVIKLAETPSDGNVKERCRQILVTSKEHLSYSRIKQVKDLFGESVFG